MNTVFIIGNGFDLKLGLKTSYQDFYDAYVEEGSSDQKEIINLKDAIQKDIDTWSDLEIQLGNHTSSLQGQDEFDMVYFDIVSSLKKYLEKEQNRIDLTTFKIDRLIKDLSNPTLNLRQRDKNKLEKWARKWKGSPHTNTHILTFNYSRTFEKLLDQSFKDSDLIGLGNKKIKLGEVQHIHGFVDGSLVLGVNDIEQIKNEKMRSSRSITETLVKPIHNQELGHTRDERCMQLIASANLIVIFGSSIGESDKIWWKKIGDRLGDECSLVIYRHGGKVEEQQDIQTVRGDRAISEHFLSLTSLDESQRQKAEDYIYVGAAEDLFNLERIQTRSDLANPLLEES